MTLTYSILPDWRRRQAERLAYLETFQGVILLAWLIWIVTERLGFKF